jgi:ABC-type branched-subunit amino acid transport system ATPase component
MVGQGAEAPLSLGRQLVMTHRRHSRNTQAHQGIQGIHRRQRRQPAGARGSIHALIGPNGAGKTTCFNLLTKFLSRPTAPSCSTASTSRGERPAQIARRGVIRSFQISAVFPHLTVLENVRIGLQRQLGTAFQFWRSERTLNVLNDRAMQLLEQVGLAGLCRPP